MYAVFFFDLPLNHDTSMYVCVTSITIETVLLYSNFVMYKALATVQSISNGCYTGADMDTRASQPHVRTIDMKTSFEA